MSGFLQRIAAGAVQPKAVAHPFVESIYPVAHRGSMARREAPGEPVLQAGAVQADVLGEQVETQDDNSELLKELVRRDGELLHPADDTKRHRMSVSEERESFEPLLSRRGIEGQESTRSKLGAEEFETGLFSETPALSHDFANSLASSTYQPLVTEQFAQEPAIDANRLSPIHPMDTYASAAPNPGWRPAQGPRTTHSTISQGEDIQIHIGRIEVVAVQQVQPRPTTASPRKGLSLDEYLGRANGRGR